MRTRHRKYETYHMDEIFNTYHQMTTIIGLVHISLRFVLNMVTILTDMLAALTNTLAET